MARVTVEDCVDKVESRFDLVLYSAFRSREMAEGAELHVERENDKHPVVLVDDDYSGDRDSGHLYLMQACENHIIANSTYSWWAAFLGNAKITVGPKKWFTNENGSEIMLSNWIKL